MKYSSYKKIVSLILILALNAVYLSAGIRTLCITSSDETMSCCKTKNTGHHKCGTQSTDELVLKSVDQCPCPSMQSGQNTDIENGIPVSGKTETKQSNTDNISLLSCAPVGETPVFLVTGHLHSCLTTQQRLSFLQAYLI